jgi:hypothetical protein
LFQHKGAVYIPRRNVSSVGIDTFSKESEMKDVFGARSDKRVGGGRLLLLLSLCFMAATTVHAAPFNIVPGSVGGDNYSVIAYGAPAVAGAPTFGANGNLTSPGLGYSTLGANVGASQIDTGGIAGPVGNLQLGLNTAATAATIPNALFGAGLLSYTANNGGVFWNNFFQSDLIVDNNFSTSLSRGIASYNVNVNIPIGQAGVILGVQGFLPPGTQAFASLAGTTTLMAGAAVVQKAENAVVITGENNGSLLPNTVQNVSVPVAGGVNQGVAANSSLFYASALDAFGDLNFISYGVALFNGAAYVPGQTLSLDGTLTLAVDPMADLQFFMLPLNLPGGNPFPLIGFQAEGVPEPASLVMAGTACLFGLGYWKLRRKPKDR